MNPDEIAARVKTLRDQGASNEEVHRYLIHVVGATEADPNVALHKEYASGQLAHRIARENLNDQEMAAAETPGLAQRTQATAEAVVGGVPGGRLAIRGLRELTGEDPEAIKADMAANQDAMNTAHPFLGKYVAPMIGGGAVMAGLPGSAAFQGGAYGALSEALSDKDVTLGQRAFNTVAGGITGAGVGKGLSYVGQGGAKLAAKYGLTDKVSAGLSKFGGQWDDLASALGTRGAANKFLGARQDVLDAVGGPSSGSQQAIDRLANFKAQAKTMYDAARADQNVVSHPAVQKVWQDPDIQAAFDLEATLRGRAGHPVPTSTELTPTPIEQLPSTTAQSPAPSVQDAIDNFWTRVGQTVTRDKVPNTVVNPFRASNPPGTPAQQQAIESLARRSAESTTPGYTTGTPPHPEPLPPPDAPTNLPDPEALHMTKRLMDRVVQQSFGSGDPAKIAAAARIASKVNDLRTVLHDVSPSYRAADAFYHLGKVGEEGVSHGMTATRAAAQDPTASNLIETTPAATREFIRSQKTSPAQAAARSGVQTGARGEMVQQIDKTDFTRGLKGLLGQPTLRASPAAAEARALTESPTLEDALLGVQRQNAEESLAFGRPNTFRQNLFGNRAPYNYLEAPLGQEELARASANAGRIPSRVAASRRGAPNRDAILKWLQTAAVTGTSPERFR